MGLDIQHGMSHEHGNTKIPIHSVDIRQYPSEYNTHPNTVPSNMGDLTPGSLVRIRLVIRPLLWLVNAEPHDRVDMVHVGSHAAVKWLSGIPVFPKLVHGGDGGGMGGKTVKHVQLLTNPRVEVGLAIECGKTYHGEFSQ
jgi:hypothetical protein